MHVHIIRSEKVWILKYLGLLIIDIQSMRIFGFIIGSNSYYGKIVMRPVEFKL